MNETVSKSNFDHVAFCRALDGIREHQAIDTRKRFAEVIGVGPDILYRLEKGEGITFEAFAKIVAYSKLDLRNYLIAGEPPTTPTALALGPPV